MSGHSSSLRLLRPLHRLIFYFSVLRSRKLKMRYSELSLWDRIRTRTRFGTTGSSSTVKRSRDFCRDPSGSPRGDRCRFWVKFSLPSISGMVSILSRQRVDVTGGSILMIGRSASNRGSGSNGSSGSRSSRGKSSMGSSCGLGKR